MKTLGELWFPSSRDEAAAKANIRTTSNSVEEVTEMLTRDPVAEKVSVIMGVSDKFPDRQSPLEDFLHQVCFSSVATVIISSSDCLAGLGL
jgi:hypothetical protein